MNKEQQVGSADIAYSIIVCLCGYAVRTDSGLYLFLSMANWYHESGLKQYCCRSRAEKTQKLNFQVLCAIHTHSLHKIKLGM